MAENLTLVVAPAPDRQFPARALGLDSLAQFARGVGLFLAAAGRGFLNRLFNRFTGFTGALLNAAQQFFVLALGKLRSSSVSLAHFCFSLPLVMFQSPLISSLFIALFCFFVCESP